MHDIQKIRDNPEKFAELQKRRGVKIDVEEIITLDSSKRTQMTKLQNLQNERNELSKQIGLQKGNDKNCQDCWFTSAVSQPFDQGNTI